MKIWFCYIEVVDCHLTLVNKLLKPIASDNNVAQVKLDEFLKRLIHLSPHLPWKQETHDVQVAILPVFSDLLHIHCQHFSWL